MDFAAFYAAGQAEAAGLSPYRNHVARDPDLWDGVARYRHSRFLYPPLVAKAFVPLAGLPYATAKRVWTISAFPCLAVALWLALRRFRLDRSPHAVLVTLFLTLSAQPTLALLERGQIDAVTLALVMAALTALASTRPRADFAAGVSLAVATMLKLHCAFFVPFLLLRRRHEAAAFWALSTLALLALGGPSRTLSYVREELPRISRYGEAGPRGTLLPPDAFRSVLPRIAPGETWKDGTRYRTTVLALVTNASAVRTPLGKWVWQGMKRLAPGVPPGAVSAVLFAACLAVVAARPPTDPAFWLVPLPAVLLCAPVTWAMGAVWLLPLAVIPLRDPGRRVPTALCVLGLALACVPDAWSNAALSFAGHHKYVLAELLCLAGLAAGVKSSPNVFPRRPPRGSSPTPR